MAVGKFQPSWESLAQYQVPEWYRDAKFGIWAHWGPGCQPEQGDWYARKMYIEGEADYLDHLARYGHPSEFGFKEICHAWKAENWNPEALMKLYKRAGAQYFVALANFHDNFDNWNSKYQPWNSVNIGPKKDLIGGWAAAARKEGLRFGVTLHGARAWEWYDVTLGADKSGPKKGVPYDGKLTKADGKGTWWEGYDPQDLYAQDHGPGQSEAYTVKFYNRCLDLLNRYHPDLLYFDDSTLPLSKQPEIGLGILAHFYNASAQWHHGCNEAVVNLKQLTDEQKKCMVWDIEAGRSPRCEPLPWQTDACIGDWHYLRRLYDEKSYRTPDVVIRTLVDIVSKNGNLQLNIPVRGDGTLDSEEIKFLELLGGWMQVNGEGIFGTRPWIIFGEGPDELGPAENWNEGLARPLDARDIRFTTKGEVVYAYVLGWPADKLLIHSMAKGSALVSGEIAKIELLGSDARLNWQRTSEALAITLPDKKPNDCVYCFKITGLKTVANADTSHLDYVPKAKPKYDRETGRLVTQQSDGRIVLDPEAARLPLKESSVDSMSTGRIHISVWGKAVELASWRARVVKPGTFTVTALIQGGNAQPIIFDINGKSLIAKPPEGSQYATVEVGEVTVKQPGEISLVLRPPDPATWKGCTLAEITLTPKK
jgi:alpha-L-fucosidase